MPKAKRPERERVSFRFPPGLMKRIEEVCRKDPMKFPTATQFVVLACDSLLWEMSNQPKGKTNGR